ncbi:MAG: Peptidoglycan endopeptidase LytF [Chlamydiae bacterium]|nr:Peptidoglycan endopeptidase LytF [Chlamydiota bacterium]
MSRRDTIIIAVLVNAGLLMVLFATAMRSDGSKSLEIADATPAVQEVMASPSLQSQEDILASYASPPTLCNPSEEIVLEEEFALTLPPTSVEKVVKVEPSPQPAQPRVAPSFQGSVVNVTVKKGDALEKIARANNTSVAAIMDANKLNSSQLKIGQVLRVPVGSGTVKQVRASVSEEFYIVKDGDSPWLIASKNSVRLDELLRLNGLDDHRARRLRPGDRLRIR